MGVEGDEANHRLEQNLSTGKSGNLGGEEENLHPRVKYEQQRCPPIEEEKVNHPFGNADSDQRDLITPDLKSPEPYPFSHDEKCGKQFGSIQAKRNNDHGRYTEGAFLENGVHSGGLTEDLSPTQHPHDLHHLKTPLQIIPTTKLPKPLNTPVH